MLDIIFSINVDPIQIENNEGSGFSSQVEPILQLSLALAPYK